MIIDIKIPSPGESISEVELANWLVNNGDLVQKDQELAEVESDKATLPLIAEKSGKIEILINEGETVKVGTVACRIDTSVEVKVEAEAEAEAEKKVKAEVEVEKMDETIQQQVEVTKKQEQVDTPPASDNAENIKTTPLAKKLMEDSNLSVDDIINGLRKITTHEVRQVLASKSEGLLLTTTSTTNPSRDIQRDKMSQLRRKLSTRLVEVKNQTAMLTTFNEVDMSEVIRLRKQYQKAFTEKHGIKLGFMSFFAKASAIALQHYPKVNSQIDGEELLSPKYVDISIAVQTDKGLMVPVLRNVEQMGLADIENSIKDLADKARRFRLSIEEMSGGTFTITNGGVFGSMLSTPILNPPQSGILGMHNIVERPVVVNGKVEIRPIMYLALSYDHRIVDGRDSVSFLKKVKELIENPISMLSAGANPEALLLEI